MNNLKTLRSESVFEPDSDISVKQEKNICTIWMYDNDKSIYNKVNNETTTV